MPGILDLKEQLYNLQQDLLSRAPSVVQISLNVPGGFSLFPWQDIMTAACKTVHKLLAVRGDLIIEELELQTAAGPYCLIALHTDGFSVKADLVALEESEPRGRLWDLDVVTENGAIDRLALGLPPRQCLLCSLPAHECRRIGNHAGDEVIRAAQNTQP
ncbi:MAG: holo-ACP synthase [Bacillota bacterium]|nr:MAG: holo-ACP synthase [Bacillota bacterium]MBS3949703.1 citrate lyase holo-[acyl-carrier protein] synthase [Peptococcaceae bacterium]